MFLPENASPIELSALPALGVNSLVATNGTAIDSGSAVSVICAFPLSGQYGPGARALYYVLVVICVVFNSIEWARDASLAAALLFPAVGALHALVLAAISQDHGPVDNDIFGTFQLCAIGVLCVPITVRYSKKYFESKGRNLVFMCTVLYLAGLLGLVVAFWRATPEPCLDSNGQNVTFDDFWGLQRDNPQGVCTTPRWPNGCTTATAIRKDPSNPSQWVPAPHQGMTLNTATLLCAGCCIPAVLSLLSVWQKVMRLRWIQLWTGRHGSTEPATGSAPNSSVTDEEAALTKKGLTENDVRWMERRINLILGLVERIVFFGWIIAIVVLGEENFWSREMRSGVEPMTSIGQWGPIVGAALATFGSLFVILSSKDDDDSVYGDDLESIKGKPDPNNPAIQGHRAQVNNVFFKVLKILGTPSADHFQDEMHSPQYREWPFVPSEENKHEHAERKQTAFRERQETAMMSRSTSFSSMQSPSVQHVQADGGGPEGAESSRRSSRDRRWFPGRRRTMSINSPAVEEPIEMQECSFVTRSSSPATQSSPSPPMGSSALPPVSTPPPPPHLNISPLNNRERFSSNATISSGDEKYLTVNTRRRETNPPQPSPTKPMRFEFGSDEPGSRPRSTTVPIPSICITPVDSEPPQDEQPVFP
ncbi:hypothetical protein DL93DRAFT_2226674 [Clavulina sp. PMI_390]|nr:hypothetical protein DL93DRAFT_2226674 [Clavulina sp. PMI_390]